MTGDRPSVGLKLAGFVLARQPIIATFNQSFAFCNRYYTDRLQANLILNLYRSLTAS